MPCYASEDKKESLKERKGDTMLDIDKAEEVAITLLDNGYGEDALAVYDKDQLEMIIMGSHMSGFEAINTMSSDDPALKEFLADLKHFEDTLQAEIDRRVAVDL